MPEDNVLEVGTGSGFVTSCLAKMSASVTSIELHQEFSAQAQKHTQAKDISNIDFIVADIFQYLDNLKNYDVIAVTGSSPKELSQLSAHPLPGGRMFSIIGKEPVMTAILTTCISDNSYRHEKLFETSLPALIMPPGEKEFLF
jgi:protein-L-isoaspartate(D-aspartate) O-methyltransferase